MTERPILGTVGRRRSACCCCKKAVADVGTKEDGRDGETRPRGVDWREKDCCSVSCSFLACLLILFFFSPPNTGDREWEAGAFGNQEGRCGRLGCMQSAFPTGGAVSREEQWPASLQTGRRWVFKVTAGQAIVETSLGSTYYVHSSNSWAPQITTRYRSMCLSRYNTGYLHKGRPAPFFFGASQTHSSPRPHPPPSASCSCRDSGTRPARPFAWLAVSTTHLNKGTRPHAGKNTYRARPRVTPAHSPGSFQSR